MQTAPTCLTSADLQPSARRRISRLTKPFTIQLQLTVSGNGLVFRMGRGCRLSIEQGALSFSLTTTFSPKPLTVVANPSVSAGSRQAIIRYTGPHLALFVDGVLVDEEWPAGDVEQGADLELEIGPAAPSGLCIFDRALSDDEIIALAGGPAAVAQRELEILGPEFPVGPYWHPRGHNTGVGDCMPFFHDGRFHLFYLFDRRHHFSKWEKGAHQWAHASTTDLVHWQHHSMAVPITQEWEGSICTGSVFHWQGVYYAFYAVRTMDGSPAPLHAATSTDGIHFAKGPALAQLELPYQPGPARDPVIFRDPQTNQFHMLVTSELAQSRVARHGGCLAQLVSDDFVHWKQGDPFLVPGYTGQPECPDHFYWNGWYYLIFSNDAVARYRMSRSATGPWHRPAQDVFDGPQAAVLKTAAFTGNRRLGVAFLNKERYAGEVVFRELIQHADGTLGTRFVDEMRPARRDPVSLRWAALTPGVTISAAVGIDVASQFAAAFAESLPQDFHLRMRVHASADSSAFGVCIRGVGAYEDGYELRLEPSRQKVSWRPTDRNSIDEGEREAIYNMAGLAGEITLEITAKGDILDVCVDGRRTLVIRCHHPAAGDRLFLFAHNAKVTFDQIEIVAL